jgi:hypothetical protein
MINSRRPAVLVLLALTALTGCSDGDPVSAVEPREGAVPGAIPGAPPLVQREPESAVSAAFAPVLRAVRSVSRNPLQLVLSRTVDDTRTTLTFEGGQNDAFLRDDVEGFGRGFTRWVTLVDTEAGGSGLFANEPSPSSVAFWDIEDETCLSQGASGAGAGDEEEEPAEGISDAPCARYRDIVFEKPVRWAGMSYASYVPVTLTAYDAGGRVVATAQGAANYGRGSNPAGDAGPYNLFSPIQVAATGDVIVSVRIEGYIMYTGIDDISIGWTNLAPVPAPGGPYAVSEGSPITLSASGSRDPEDERTGLTYAWIVGGSALSGENVGVTFQDDQDGGYPVTLTVTDQNGKSASAQTVVAVQNVAPAIADQLPVQLAQRDLTHTLSFTDPGADEWTATIDYDVARATDAVQTLSLGGRSVPLGHTYPSAGTYTVSVTVSDGDGGVDTETFQVTTGNSPVEIGEIAGATIDEGGTYSAGGSFSDTDPGPWTLTVSYGDGTPAVTTTTSTRGFALSHLYEDDGSFPVQVTVADPQSSASASATVTVNNVAPTASFSAPATLLQGGTLTLSLGSPSDPSQADREAGFSYAFDCGAGYGAFTSSPSTTCATSQTGMRAVRGKIRDKDGGTTEYSSGTMIAVPNPPPSVTVSAPSGGVPCVAGYGAAKVSATVSDDDPLSYGWYLGSALRSASLNATIALPLGTHTLDFRATEQRSGGASTTRSVSVSIVDDDAPVVSVSATPNRLIADHKKYERIEVTLGAVDACTLDASAGTAVGYVVSSDPDDAPGAQDGSTTGDIRVTHLHDGNRVELSSAADPRVEIHAGDRLEVRSERFGSNPRYYTISYTARDSGGSATRTETIRVGPNDD